MNELERFATKLRQSVDGLVNTVMQFQELKTTAKIHHSTLELVVGRIEEQEIEVIVNATGTSLTAGNGIDADIHRKAGPQLAAASRALAPCRAGDAVLTPGFRLPAPWVIHTVGPIYAGGYQDEAATLDQAYRSSMTLAVRSGLTHMALPPIGAGAYGYPIQDAAQIALGAVLEFIDGYRNSELLIRLVMPSRADFTVYDQVLRAFAQTDIPSDAPTSADQVEKAEELTSEAASVVQPNVNTDDEPQPWRYQSTASAAVSDAAVSNVALSNAASEPDFVLTLEPEMVLSVEPEPIMSVEPMPVLSIEPEPVLSVEAEPEPVLSVDLPVDRAVGMPTYYNPEQENFEEEEEEFALTQEERDAARGELVEALQGLETARAGFEEEIRQAEEESQAQHEETVADFIAANEAARAEEETVEPVQVVAEADKGTVNTDAVDTGATNTDTVEEEETEPAQSVAHEVEEVEPTLAETDTEDVDEDTGEDTGKDTDEIRVREDGASA